MRTFRCSCNESLFFDNSQCVSCGREVGFCPACRLIVALHGHESIGYRCGNPKCNAALSKCYNYQLQSVCNRCVLLETSTSSAEKFCDCCRYNEIIPDLSKGDNREKWRRLEAAKRRVFYHLDLLGLPHGNVDDALIPPLSFDFKEQVAPTVVTDWGGMGTTNVLDEDEVVMTGHLNGKITINILEADPVERERLRVQFGEPHRSLIGHFRHEIAHYYWDLLIKGKREDVFKHVFGDHNNPTYNSAMQQYYQFGPPHDWRDRFVSAYASMHPWEDFAETFSAYLEMIAALDTAHHMGIGGPQTPRILPGVDFDAMVSAYIVLGTALNEMNRTMGLKDLLTRSLLKPVAEKMRSIHRLIGEARTNLEQQSLDPMTT